MFHILVVFPELEVEATGCGILTATVKQSLEKLFGIDY